MSTSKLIDLRDCEDVKYQRIFEEMEKIVWEMQGLLARILIKVFKSDASIQPVWSRRWEYPWAILSADVKQGMTILDGGCSSSPLLPYLAL
jgi:hypothetical protein